MSIDLEALEKLARAATPGPWEQGDVWLWAGVQPESFGEGRCALCERHGPPVWVGTTDINGEVRLAHKHRDPEPYDLDHDISAEDGLVAGNYGYEEGGIINPEDCAYIAAVSPDVVLALIAEVERLRAQPCPHVVTHGTTSHCTLAESSALRQPVSPPIGGPPWEGM